MPIPFTEPVSPKYIYINPETNQVHLLVPIVGGQEISTDNTCKATLALREFFAGEALRELIAYKNALEFDIALLEVGNLERVRKEERLVQIEAYIEAVSAMQYSYIDAITALMSRASNLYSIQLRPHEQDHQSKVVSPTFNIERSNDDQGNPKSALYNAMHSIFPSVTVHDARTKLINAVLSNLPALTTFATIQYVLKEQCAALFDLPFDFTKRADSTPVTRTAMDTLMGFGSNVTQEDYVDALLGVCASDIWKSIPMSPFYTMPVSTSVNEKTEHLSILTQFFLAILNVYCRSKGISSQNFGVILDTSETLSNDLVNNVSTALSVEDDIEGKLCTFCNEHATEFGLSRPLNEEDVIAIRQKFERTYRAVTDPKENPHMDDFMILDMDAIGENAKFVMHQGTICVDFAEIVDPVATATNPKFFTAIRADFAGHPIEIPPKNEGVRGEIDLEPEILLARINDDKFEKLPKAIKNIYRTHPIFQTRRWLRDVAQGKRDKALAFLTLTPDKTQTLLRTPGVFTDYSGRTFNCTAYEYAYWAKDTHTCRMLERHMDEDTKALLSARIDHMERIDPVTGDKTGLTYQQHGQTHRSAHFDFTPLKQALQHYVDGYNNWFNTIDMQAMQAAWLAIGKAQRDVPAHVAQEYCRTDRSFNPIPSFHETTLPCVLKFFNFSTGQEDDWFPLPGPNVGFGFDFTLVRTGSGKGEGRGAVVGAWRGGPSARHDLAAITRLDEVRTADLTQSREHLNVAAENANDIEMAPAYNHSLLPRN